MKSPIQCVTGQPLIDEFVRLAGGNPDNIRKMVLTMEAHDVVTLTVVRLPESPASDPLVEVLHLYEAAPKGEG